MKKQLLIALLSALLCITPVFAFANTQDPEFQNPQADGSFSAQKSLRDIVGEALNARRWNEGPNTKSDGSAFFVGIGIGAIQAPHDHPNYLQSRINAFEKALLDSKRALAGYVGTSIQQQAEKSYIEPPPQMPTMDKKTDRPLTLWEKSQLLAHAKLDELLRREGIDPSKLNQKEKEEALARLTSQEEFKGLVKVLAQTRISGMQVFQCFEGPGEGKGYAIAVVSIYSDRLRDMARSIYTGEKPAVSSPKIPIIEQISPDPEILLTTFGVQQKTDENGNLVLVAFGQGAPTSESSNAINMAYRKAEVSAMGYLRAFAGENYLTSGDLENAETTKEFEDATKEYFNQSSFDDKIRSKSEALNISGIATIKRWSTKHPLTGRTATGVVMTWSPQEAARAQSIGHGMAQTPERQAGSAGKASTSQPQQLDHSGRTGVGSAADEDSF